MVSIKRRTFIAAGIVGAAALAAAGWLRGPHAPASGVPRRALDADGEAIFAAVAPVLLEGALPVDKTARATAMANTMTGIDAAVAGLSPNAQAELRQLIALLALPPVRFGIARVSDGWPAASPAQVRRFLDQCRASRFTLMRAAYDALHALTFASWYGNADAWAAIGYPGPPSL
ncbi:MAG: hypothetical protein U1F54_11205 [Burkholderiales bacterium]